MAAISLDSCPRLSSEDFAGIDDAVACNESTVNARDATSIKVQEELADPARLDFPVYG